MRQISTPQSVYEEIRRETSSGIWCHRHDRLLTHCTPDQHGWEWDDELERWWPINWGDDPTPAKALATPWLLK